MEKYCIKNPVLLIGFNRPDIIQQNIENLQQFDFNKLYVAVDGPRPYVQGEKERVDQVRNLVKNIKFCERVYYKINETNQGCEVTESSAISWVLENEEAIIVLEDDIIAHKSFFMFMDEMLARYKDNKKIAMVSGCNFSPMPFPNNEDYCFCQSGHTWGWATWKRVWQEYSLYEEIDNKFLTNSFLNNNSANKGIALRRKALYLDMQMRGKGNNTWDYMFSYFRVTRGLLSIVPRSHLTSNVGLFGLHARGKEKGHNLPIDDSFEVHNHPKKVIWFKEYDIHHYKEWSKSKRTIKSSIKNILVYFNLYKIVSKHLSLFS